MAVVELCCCLTDESISPDAFDSVRVKLLVDTDDWHVFHNGLGDQQPVKGIAMVKWQIRNLQEMRLGYRKDGKLTPSCLRQKIWKGRRKSKLSDA